MCEGDLFQQPCAVGMFPPGLPSEPLQSLQSPTATARRENYQGRRRAPSTVFSIPESVLPSPDGAGNGMQLEGNGRPPNSGDFAPTTLFEQDEQGLPNPVETIPPTPPDSMEPTQLAGGGIEQTQKDAEPEPATHVTQKSAQTLNSLNEPVTAPKAKAAPPSNEPMGTSSSAQPKAAPAAPAAAELTAPAALTAPVTPLIPKAAARAPGVEPYYGEKNSIYSDGTYWK